jgi:ArsR family transcriptional regulator
MAKDGMGEIHQLRAEVFKAMAHPARLQMLDAMAEREMCVCDLAELVDLAVPTVSRHLKKMKAAGLVGIRRDGNHIYHRLQMPCMTELFHCIDEVLGADDDRVRELCRMLDSTDSASQ